MFAISYILASAITCACATEKKGTVGVTILTQAEQQNGETQTQDGDWKGRQTTGPSSIATASAGGPQERYEKGRGKTSSADAWSRDRHTHQDLHA